MAHTLMEQKLQAKAERISEGNKRKWENNNNNNNRRNYRNNNRHNQNNNQRHGNARALTTTQNEEANQTGVASKSVVCYECGERGHKSNACPKRADRQGGNVRGQAYAIRDAEHNQGPNVVTGVHVDPAKVEAIQNWSAPTTPTETEAIKEENVKAENLGRLIKPIFEIRSDGIQCFEGRIWLPLFGGLQDLIMHES
ncbi:putative reverse transcriptase domain-containing protein [Tanacetum coccineum]